MNTLQGKRKFHRDIKHKGQNLSVKVNLENLNTLQLNYKVVLPKQCLGNMGKYFVCNVVITYM